MSSYKAILIWAKKNFYLDEKMQKGDRSLPKP